MPSILLSLRGRNVLAWIFISCMALVALLQHQVPNIGNNLDQQLQGGAPAGNPHLIINRLKTHILGSYVSEMELLKEFNGTLHNESQFYDILNSKQALCKKIITLGGRCAKHDDGDKEFCLDHHLSPPQNNCLVYSFGIGDDLTFEDALTTFKNCEIHMFDPTLNRGAQSMMLPQDLLSNQHFHLIGLGDKDEKEHHIGKDPEYIEIRKLDTIMKDLGHMERTIHYMKIDVEGSEWKSLSYMVQHGLLDNVWQLAMELHTDQLNNQPYESWLALLQNYLEILRSVEALGFLRVSYRENRIAEGFIKLPHEDFPRPGCGEILYVRNVSSLTII